MDFFIIQKPLGRIIFILFFANIYSIDLEAVNEPKKAKALRINHTLHIDGEIKEEEWRNAEPASQFLQQEPDLGAPSRFNTEVYIQYDNQNIYVAAKMHDPEPDKILKELSPRDNVENADQFVIFFDPFLSGLNGFLFGVSASGVQTDAIVSDHDDDDSWNAVWDSRVKINHEGWSVELKIPYSALRFPKLQVQEWGLQCKREIRRFRETSFWNYIDPNTEGWVQQSGRLLNLESIKAPVRLSLTPYISQYLNLETDARSSGGKTQTDFAYGAGLDLKYGLTDAFTLDMTLIPDFNQVISDKKVLNLSPFEVYFDENRQFFTEGTELFNKGDLFYSRRVGEAPFYLDQLQDQLQSNEQIIESPEISSLINASKISGRTKRGTGIGFFNAIVDREYALVKNANDPNSERKILTNPLTNYNAVVIDQNLKNNSYISLINTNVTREGKAYDANVSSGFFNLRTKNQKYYVQGDLGLSNKISEQNSYGTKYYLKTGKASGKWTYSLAHGYISNNFDVNDFGFLFLRNQREYEALVKYEQYKPKNPKIQTINFSQTINYQRIAKPDNLFDFYALFNSFVLFKSRFAFGTNLRLEPVDTRDYFEPRTFDFIRYVRFTSNYGIGGFISSDYRKPFAIDANVNFRYFNTAPRRLFSISATPRYRFSNRFSITANIIFNKFHMEPGWVNKSLVTTPIADFSNDDILIGVRNRNIFDNSLTLKYSFSSLMGINTRIRYYHDKVLYQNFNALLNDGRYRPLNYSGQNDLGQALFDQQLNIFNIDMQFQWRFAPGSDLFLVWKNEIFYQNKNFDQSYFQNFTGLFDEIQGNSFSVRVLYYLDYLRFVKKSASSSKS